jgi:hypothetical protein
MAQLRIPGFPAGAISINSSVSVLKKDGHVTYCIGSDNYFSHPEEDKAGERFAIATLIVNQHMRAVEVERSALAIPHRTLMRWCKQLEEKGAGSFYAPPRRRGALVMTAEVSAECGRLLADGLSTAEVARQVGVDASTLGKAKLRGDIVVVKPTDGSAVETTTSATTKSDRTHQDAAAAEGMGTACTRAGERLAAAFGLVHSASARHEHCQDVMMGGVLAGLPSLCANGLLSGLDKHLSLPSGFYSAVHVLTTLGFMALARIRRPEKLRQIPPGELGKVIGLDRVPEVRTLRQKVALMAGSGTPEAWMHELSRNWMDAEPEEAGYLYVDGHVRVYHGWSTPLPRRYVSREKLCLRGTTDYWVNDAVGRPFFVVSKAVTEGLATTLVNQIVPELLKSVPCQPSEAELEADPLLHRFVVVFDREGATHSLLSQLWQQRIGAITYRKAVKDVWPEGEFEAIEVPVPSGGTTRMKLASKEASLSAGKSSMPVLEVRRLTKTGHQTAIITTARLLQQPVIAGRMFSRWCQENYFAYMMEHYDIDGLVQYGCEELPGDTQVVNPAWRDLDKVVRTHQRSLRKLRAELGAAVLENDEASIQMNAEKVQDIQRMEEDLAQLREQRKATPRKIAISSLPEEERPRQLMPLSKMLTDTVKMIAYRAETALVGLLRKHLATEADARALIRELFVSSADIEPDQEANTLIVSVHRMASPVHDRAIGALLEELTQAKFLHPETGMRMVYKLA